MLPFGGFNHSNGETTICQGRGPTERPIFSRRQCPLRALKSLQQARVQTESVAVLPKLFADYKATVAFLFPGLGVQKMGMAAEVAENVPAARKLFKRASDVLGYDLLKICLEGPQEKLNSALVSQPALLVTSLAAVEKLKATQGQVEELCLEASARAGPGETVMIANYLCPGNFTVAGSAQACRILQDIACPEFKAHKTVKLAVNGAFHTHIFEPVVDVLRNKLRDISVSTPRIPVLSNVDGQPHTDPDTIRRMMLEHLVRPVQWEASMREMLSRGLVKSYELGPGKALAHLFKRIDKTHPVETINI